VLEGCDAPAVRATIEGLSARLASAAMCENMAEEKWRVLVIDDDEVVLVAITDLLEAAGLKVFTQTTPIGATQVILREGINAAVIDINLPVMQGDNVIRLFRSWDKVRDLPIVVVSGATDEKLAAIKSELAGVKIVRKDEMHQRLTGAVLEALTGVRESRASKPTRNARAAEPQRRSEELPARVAHDLAQLMIPALGIWQEARLGHLERVPALAEALLRVRGQAQLLGLEPVALLTQGLADVLVALKRGRRFAQGVDKTVEHAISALSGLRASPACEFAFSPTPLTRALKEALGDSREA
jgi:CheY-like chemotaxis protein